MLKQGLDFPFENKFKAMDSIPKMHGQKIVETTVPFSIWEKKTETMDRLPKIQGQKSDETTVSFSIYKREWNYG